MTKFLQLLVLGFFILFSCSLTSATDIAYVIGDVSEADISVTNLIDDLNYSYEVVRNSEIPSTDFSEYGMILVWDGVLSNHDDLPIGLEKSFVANTYYVDDWGIADYSSVSSSTGYFYGRIQIENMINEGLSSPVWLYDVSHTPLHYLPYPYRRAPSLENVISTDNYQIYPIIGIINSGGELYNGGFADERILFFGLTETDAWTSESQQLFQNSLTWVLFGGDEDEDGFYSDDDCDDSNENVWQFISGYVDDDADGFGSGELIEICSGNEILEGHSLIGGDCDDLEGEINPDAEEIPYNLIDDNCDGFDLVDVDGDGFDAEIVGGDDCNDSDILFNPDSEDVYKNCANDAPIVDSISKIIVQETENASISVEAVDPEEDLLIYSINDSRFIQDGNIFTWQTAFEDYGTYFVEINVSDGILDSIIIVEIEVTNLNRAPVCDEIPIQEWAEDQGHILNLTDYCYDLDGEYIGFYLNETSEDRNITIVSLEEGIVNFSSEKDWFGEDWIIFEISDGEDNTLTNVISLNITPINDAPDFNGLIENISWIEDNNLSNETNLNNYFSDVDGDNLEFNVSGNSNIEITIVDGLVSFYPLADWFGNETIIFSATDGLETNHSNEVLLTLADANEPPVCDEIPIQEWGEDQGHILNLTDYCYDIDGGTLNFYLNDTSEGEHINLLSLEEGIVNFSSEKDWFGEDWIIFEISDGEDNTLTNVISLNITPINDAPDFNGLIENISWIEDNNLSNETNLNNYFSDVDGDNLEFNVSGNSNIEITIVDGLVSFYPLADWFGNETIIFSATDGLETNHSNEVLLTLADATEPPVFETMVCNLDIDEDIGYSCELNSSDVDSTELFYTIVNEDNLECETNETHVEYLSEKDYNGEASCLIRVSDGTMYDEYLLSVNVNPINDAPVIQSYSPEGILRFVKNTNHIFSVDVIDIDSLFDVSWFLGGLEGVGNSYEFNQPTGTYELEVIASDGEFNDSHIWDVFVGEISDFTCSELGGEVCIESDYCSAELSEVSDSSQCCLASCLPRPPEFKDINKCETTNN